MAQIEFTLNERVEHGPAYIRVPSPLITPKFFAPFEVNGKTVNASTQSAWYTDITTNTEKGWLGLIAGDIEYCRLLAYSILGKYTDKHHKAEWKRVTGSRYYERQEGYKSIYALDSLMMFNDQLDPIRWGNAFDLCSTHRGKSSMLVIVAGVDPAKACTISHLRPDWLFNIHPKQMKEA